MKVYVVLKEVCYTDEETKVRQNIDVTPMKVFRTMTDAVIFASEHRVNEPSHIFGRDIFFCISECEMED